ncbi:methyltransferase [Chitinibacter sp. SCUT-21]|uniref:class I SAM-dependent methyltransferase n=1 Tax=Chitinibacter sp. SCUT-21 TaxID=2970891 RepID=UPI0035A5BD32
MTAIDFAALQLQRYPSKHAKELRAWDAADEYLSEFLPENDSVILLNDAFGALHCAAEAKNSAEIWHINDSWCARKAIGQNLQSIQYQDFAGQSASLGLVKIPKSISLLQAQMLSLASQITTPITLYCSGMQKHVSNGHLDVFKACCDGVEYLPTSKKARMYRALLAPQNNPTNLQTVPVPELGIELKNIAGVFAEQKIDIGSRFFIEHFHLLPKASKVADVGCGNGLLSLAYHRLHPDAQLFLYDESMAAVQSAQLSFAHNFPQATVTIQHNDGLLDVKEQFELILINPPFHQQNTVTTDIALSMFEQASHSLVPGGAVWIVANRHLDYWQALRRRFARVDTVAQNDKFVILRASLL